MVKFSRCMYKFRIQWGTVLVVGPRLPRTWSLLSAAHSSLGQGYLPRTSDLQAFCLEKGTCLHASGGVIFI